MWIGVTLCNWSIKNNCWLVICSGLFAADVDEQSGCINGHSQHTKLRASLLASQEGKKAERIIQVLEKQAF